MQKHSRQLLITVDAGGSSLKGNLLDVQAPTAGLLLKETVLLPLDTKADKETILDTYETLFCQLTNSYSDSPIVGLAVAFPGPCDYEKGIPYMKGLNKYEALFGTSLFPEWTRSLQHCSGQSTEPKIYMQNDARLYGLGAWKRNGEDKENRIACLTLGTGCGSAFIVKGKLLTDDAEENRREGIPEDGYIYHLPWCSQMVDDSLSTRGLVKLAACQGVEVSNGKELAELARAGDESAGKAYRMFGKQLSEFIEHGLKEFKPDIVYLGGNLSLAFDLMAVDCPVSIEVMPQAENALIGAAEWWIRNEKGSQS